MDMTQGVIWKQLLEFSVPMMIGLIFQQFYNTVDTIVVGKFVGVNALAGVGATGSINFLILGFAMGITIGFGVKVGQRFGAKDYEGMRNYVANGFYLIIIISAIMTPLTMYFCKDILELTGTPEEIFSDSYNYLIWILAGTFFSMLYNATSAILRAIGDSRTPLFVLLFSSVLNIILDLLFVLAFHMGTTGVAVATVASQGISGILCLFYMFWHYEELRIRKEEFRVSLEKMAALLKQGIPMALQFSITAVGGVILQSAVNSLGSVSVAAMTAGNKISFIFSSAFESMGTTMATYCSQNLGAKEYGRIRKGIRCACLISGCLCVFSFAVVWLAGRYIALLFIDAGEMELMGQIQLFLRVISSFYPFLILIFILRNSLQAMGYSFIAMFAGVFELVGRASVAFGLVGKLGFLGVAFASPAAWVLADVILVTTYFSVVRKFPQEDIK